MIAAANGPAIGGGLYLAPAADIGWPRVAYFRAAVTMTVSELG